VRLWENPSALFEWLHLEALGDCVLLRDLLVTLGGCHHLDGLEQQGSSSRGRCLSLASIVVIVRGSWPFPGEEPKGTLVDGCATPCWGFGMWYQLVCEPPSEWITTTRASLPTNKWISVKKSYIILSLRFSLDFIVIDWLHIVIDTHLDTSV
jgi:hypothetical protein